MKHPRQQPAYLNLVAKGELRWRATQAAASLSPCQVCPRCCRARRAEGEQGFCRTGEAVRVASYGPHHGEEDCLRGARGSGTIFFCGCNLGCVFCQNWDISHDLHGRLVTTAQLATIMLELQASGCHNINWVTPSHLVPQLLAALALAADHGLRLPIVYNSSGYDALETLRWLDGVVDIFLPDFKFWDPAVARRLAAAPDYPEVARQAIREMHRQVGDLVVDAAGLARRGVLVRHLVMPNGLAGTAEIAAWLATALSPDIHLNLMAQYHPDGVVPLPAHASRFADLNRPPTRDEMRAARQAVEVAKSAVRAPRAPDT